MCDFARELERENAALRRDVYQCPPTSENDYEGFKWNDACEELERENAALRADKERLDWLSQTKCAYYYEGQCCWRINENKNTDGYTLRDAIDIARKEVQP